MTTMALRALVLLSLPVCACARNIVIRVPPSQDPGAFGPIQRCEAGERPCGDDTNFDTSRFASGATFFAMPACANGVNALLIEHAESSSPTLHARCNQPAQPAAPPGGGIPTTTPDGGTSGVH